MLSELFREAPGVHRRRPHRLRAAAPRPPVRRRRRWTPAPAAAPGRPRRRSAAAAPRAAGRAAGPGPGGRRRSTSGPPVGAPAVRRGPACCGAGLRSSVAAPAGSAVPPGRPRAGARVAGPAVGERTDRAGLFGLGRAEVEGAALRRGALDGWLHGVRERAHGPRRTSMAPESLPSVSCGPGTCCGRSTAYCCCASWAAPGALCCWDADPARGRVGACCRVRVLRG